MQGTGYLEKILAPNTGEILSYSAHPATDGTWLLDREELFLEGQRYTSRYTFDSGNRVVQQQVDYQNTAACNHLISMNATYSYANDVLTAVAIHGGYDGYQPEGAPHMEWDVAIAYAYDASGRLAREDLSIPSFTKTYTQKPQGAWRDEISRVYISMRPRRPIENVIRNGDLCGTSGNILIGNMIDLRPFYVMTPNLTMQIPYGVAKATVTFTYPESYKVRVGPPSS